MSDVVKGDVVKGDVAHGGGGAGVTTDSPADGPVNDVVARMARVAVDLDVAAARLGRARRLLDGRDVVAGLDLVLGSDGFHCVRVIDTTAAAIVWVAIGRDGSRFEAGSPVALVRAVDAVVLGTPRTTTA